MKKLIAFPAVVFCTLVLLNSCSKSSSGSFDDSTSPVPDRIITANISSGQSEVVRFESNGDLRIVKQASHFKISSTGADPENRNFVLYTYSPAAGYTGKDEVLLAYKTRVDLNTGATCNYNESDSKSYLSTSYVAVKITVTD